MPHTCLLTRRLLYCVHYSMALLAGAINTKWLSPPARVLYSVPGGQRGFPTPRVASVLTHEAHDNYDARHRMGWSVSASHRLALFQPGVATHPDMSYFISHALGGLMAIGHNPVGLETPAAFPG